MSRKCRLTTCRKELPKARESDFYQKAGFCGNDCMADHGIAKGRAAIDRKKAATARQERAQTKEARERIKTLSQHVSEAQSWVNRVVVAEDKPKGCISCDYGLVSDAGHYFHRGSKYRCSPITLDRRNLTGQCRACNSYKGGGNQHEYRIGYIARYGQAQFDALCEYKMAVDRGEIPPLTVDECRAAIAAAKARLKDLRQSE